MMPQFRWSAVNDGGEVVTGVMEASDLSAVVDRLQRRGQIVLRADPADRRGGWPELLHLELGRRRGIDRSALTEVTRELAIMLAAGQDLDRALRFVVENTHSTRARTILGNIRDKVRSGNSLAAALATEPQSFSKLYIGLVRAGEAGGSLPATLDRIATLLERERTLNASLRSALVYPALLVTAAIGSVVLLLQYVLPQFAPIFEQAGATLPASTRALMRIGTLLGALGPWLLVMLLAAGFAARQLMAQPYYRERADRLILRLPVIGKLLRETIAARLTRTLGTLLQNGVPLITALGIARDALGNLAAGAAVASAAVAAKGGGGLARPLAEAGIFPARTIHLLQLGEEAAQLAAMALKAADIHDEQARLMMQRLVALAVPTITIVMGLVVAGIVGALLSAMLRLNELAV
jgi:general secretion pathway protein F